MAFADFDVQLAFAQAQRPAGVRIDTLERGLGFSVRSGQCLDAGSNFVRRTLNKAEATALGVSKRRERHGPSGLTPEGRAKVSAARRRRAASQTHCKQGHAFAEHGYSDDRQRHCRICVAANKRAYKARKRQCLR